jgi:hypothetical protein
MPWNQAVVKADECCLTMPIAAHYLDISANRQRKPPDLPDGTESLHHLVMPLGRNSRAFAQLYDRASHDDHTGTSVR